MLLSISIPTYFMPPNGGADFLDYSLERIYNQSYNKDNIEIVISDHCLDNTIENVADRWADKLHIRYFKKDYNRDSASDNLNVAIAACTGRYVKILFQDDFLYGEDSLEKLVAAIEQNPDAAWFACGNQQYDGETFNGERYPHLSNPQALIEGNNQIGSPSVICLRKDENMIQFKDEFLWLMDVQFYYEMYMRYGLPVFIDSALVAIRTGAHQLTETLTDERKEREHILLKQQYSGL